MPKVSLVVPAYNESLRIEETIKAALKYLSSKPGSFEIIICDDGSTDDTIQKLKSLFLGSTPIKILEGKHAGKAVAVRAGVEAATGDYILMMDADSAVAIAELGKLKRKMEETQADIVIGSREGRGAQRLNEPLYRHLLGRVFNLIVKVLTGLPFEDTQCGFKLFKASAAKTLAHKSKIMNQPNKSLSEPLVTAFDVELLVLAQKYGFKTVEVPIFWRHVPTKNINPIKDSLGMFTDVLLVRRNLLTGKHD